MTQHWQHRIGSQRDWVWRGWQTRYTYIRASQPTQKTTPLLLLHGFGTSIGHWRHNLAVLGQSHTVYALDMLGFGASRKAQADYKVDLWVEQVYDFWRTFIQQPVVLVGNSIGSLVCLAVAAAHPEMVKGFVMMSLPDPSVEEEAIPAWLRPVVAGVKGVVASPVILQNVFYLVRRPSFVRKWAAIAYANPNAVTDELVDILAGPAQDRGSAAAFGAILKAMTSAKFSPSVKTLLPTLNTPMLLIWGRQDKMIPFSVLARFRDINPKLQLVELDAGHCPHDECPDEVNQIILNWLETMPEDQVDSSATPQKQLAVSD
ncbi:alpha/beta fold hydrolase [Coleofasciculus sp. FACHB-64]|uniref:alpha/beta fold hydrolase n=1 Tax=Cyanophyceae TaxID=3028117 RepID=UPI0016826EAC|nr:alpha/beta fold hydrolase [Coleofasciculus sp. FACHB-501]MBD1891059.1 alpha/beta fold hydrolase [Coleofasciculus sp. FACHB-SPT9]MBD1943621.1 alpha/beta fold hydrolase [Coleofasciculus sp. FACHB-712]MBD2047449.1 alpha/beta fold hydrolase [Coleofasciculus sp. FACHB-64]